MQFIFRGDAHPFSQERLASRQIVGRVFKVQRNDRSFVLDRGFWRFAGRLWILLPSIIRQMVMNCIYPEKFGTAVLNWIQQRNWYRVLMRSIIFRSIQFREAAEKDIPFLSHLFAYQRHYPDEDPVHKLRDHYHQICKTGWICIADYRGQIAGVIVLNQEMKLNQSSRHWRITRLIVRHRFRRLGIGQYLIRQSIERIQGEGGLKIQLFVFRDNQAAIHLYEKTGFKIEAHPDCQTMLDEETRKGRRSRIVMSQQIHKKSKSN